MPSNDPRNNRGTHFGSSILLITQVANVLISIICIRFVFSVTQKEPFVELRVFFTDKEVRKQTINAYKIKVCVISTSILKESRQCLFSIRNIAWRNHTTQYTLQ